MQTWIGAGGWGYFRGPSGRPLSDYALGFRFVEVNSTFYRHPSLLTARRWRRSVPEDFRFAVKGHRTITHTERFRATRPALSALARDSAISAVLGADILVLETPPDLRFGPGETAALKDFSGALGAGQRIALEARGHAGGPLPSALATVLREVGGIDVVDLSKEDGPRVDSDVAYTRLFGKGAHNIWEFSDEELREIDASAASRESNRMVFAFHGVRMYKDAARFAEFRSGKPSPPATRERGQRALGEVLSPDAKFPATRESLLRDHGWKVVTAEGGENVHAAAYLQHLPDRRFESLDEALDSLAAPKSA